MGKAKIVMFFPNVVYGSVDICGRIAADGVDKEIIESLNRIEYLDEMRDIVEDINFKHYGMKHRQNTYRMTESYSYSELCDLSEQYNEKFGTVWLFIKNLRGGELEIRGADGLTYILPHRKVGVFYCGMACDGLVEAA